MCRDFHVAEFVSVGDTLRAVSPIAVRCWLTRSTTWLASSVLTVPQLGSGVQFPTTADAAGGASGKTAGPANATASSTTPACSARFNDFGINVPSR
jgi:hypothetical protein